MKKISKILFVMLIVFSAFFVSVQAKTIYVDKKTGSNGYDGSQEKPYRTIQKGVDNAAAGDTVIVKKNVYYETVHIKVKGTADNPITIKAEEGTVVTNANEAIYKNLKKDIWKLEDENLQLYSADLVLDTGDTVTVNPTADSLFPARVLADYVDLLQYYSLDALKNFVLNDNDLYYLDGFPYGYYYDAVNKKIYVRLREDGKLGSSNPNDHVMKVSPTYYTKTGLGSMTYGLNVGYGSYNMLVGDKYTLSAAIPATETRMPSYNVIIDGFTFETPGLTGVFLRSSDVTVRNCKFYGCRFGIKGATRVLYDLAYSDNIVVENCEYTQYPTYDEAEEFIKDVNSGAKQATDRATGKKMKYTWWHKKSNGTETYGINTDLRYETGGLVGNVGENWVIRNNLITNVFDGIGVYAMTKYFEKKYYNGKAYTVNVGAENIEIYNNRFERCLDNAIEMEEHGKNIRIYNNEFIDNFLPLSWQPTKGPEYPTNIYIYKNLIYNTASFGKFWSQNVQYANFAFKIGVQTTNWNFPWSEPLPEDGERVKVTLAENGLNIYNNTVIMPYGYPIAFVNANKDGWSEFNPLFENMRFKNNVVINHVKKAPDVKNGYLWDGITADTVGGIGNCVLSNTGIEYSDNIFAPDMNDGYVSTQLTSNGGVCLKNIEELKLNALTMRRYDVGAQEDSPLFNITVSDKKYGDYIGAVGKGKSYSSPVCGVQKE